MLKKSYTLTADLSKLNGGQACKSAMQHAFPKMRIWNWFFWISFVIGLVLMLTPQLGFGSIQTIVGIFLVFGLMFINLVVVIRRRRKIMSTMYSAPTTNGLTDYKLTSNTIEIKSTGHKATYYWSHILDAIPTPQGVLILIGQLEFIQIPNASLPEELSKEEFIALLRNWIKDSRK